MEWFLGLSATVSFLLLLNAIKANDDNSQAEKRISRVEGLLVEKQTDLDTGLVVVPRSIPAPSPQKDIATRTSGRCVGCYFQRCPDCNPTPQKTIAYVSVVDPLAELRHSQNNTRALTSTVQCFKCKGRGRIAKYRHINHGRCYLCQGSGRITA